MKVNYSTMNSSCATPVVLIEQMLFDAAGPRNPAERLSAQHFLKIHAAFRTISEAAPKLFDLTGPFPQSRQAWLLSLTFGAPQHNDVSVPTEHEWWKGRTCGHV